jgi:hypothetical protein
VRDGWMYKHSDHSNNQWVKEEIKGEIKIFGMNKNGI